MLLDNYDDFNFMVILLFIYFILAGFIIVIIINLKNRKKIENAQAALNASQSPLNTLYPQSTIYPNITLQKCIPNVTDGKC